MTIRMIVLAAAAFTALSPAIAAANPEKASVQACVRAFATRLGVAGDATPAYRLAYRGSLSGNQMDNYIPAEYTYTLEAHDRKTGAAYARALCSTNTRGAVTALSVIPVDAKSATWAAGL
jgi:hypothetical protein